MSPEEIVRKLAAIEAPIAVGYMDRQYCAVHRECNAIGEEPPSHHHPDCPWRMAREWVEQSPEPAKPAWAHEQTMQVNLPAGFAWKHSPS